MRSVCLKTIQIFVCTSREFRWRLQLHCTIQRIVLRPDVRVAFCNPWQSTIFMNLPNAVSRSLYRRTRHLLKPKIQKSLLWRLPNYGLRRDRPSVLGRGILEHPPELLVASTTDEKEYDVLRSSVFKSLDKSPLEQMLPSVHDDMKSHHKNISKLVVEEAIMACIIGEWKESQ